MPETHGFVQRWVASTELALARCVDKRKKARLDRKICAELVGGSDSDPFWDCISSRSDMVSSTDDIDTKVCKRLGHSLASSLAECISDREAMRLDRQGCATEYDVGTDDHLACVLRRKKFREANRGRDLAREALTCAGFGASDDETNARCARVLKRSKAKREERTPADDQILAVQQASDLMYLRRAAEKQQRNRELDAIINFLAPIVSGGYPNNQGLGSSGGLKTCRYQVGGQVATHTISATSVCPVSMSFGGVLGVLRP